MRTVSVQHAAGRYDVRIGPGLVQSLDERIRELAPGARRVTTVQDRGAPPEPILEAGARLMRDYEQQIILYRPSEPDKSLAWHEEILKRMAGDGMQRSDVVVAYGGGVTGDLAGYAAATYRRGCALIQCPTTLLAMVDASVGGKTGVNLEIERTGLLKNAVGAFHQPLEVIADTDTLATLDDRVYRCGLAECAKHALIAGDWDDADLLGWTEANADAILARDSGTLTELIARNVAVKARVVEADEREDASKTKGRALLNLGHTFAHAIEPLDGLAPDGGHLMHGEAVALGLIAACNTSVSLGLVPVEHAHRVRKLLLRLGLPISTRSLPTISDLLERMGHDKKATAGKLRMVLPVSTNSCETTDAPATEHIEAGWSSIAEDMP